jgi:hypothetical protein
MSIYCTVIIVLLDSTSGARLGRGGRETQEIAQFTCSRSLVVGSKKRLAPPPQIVKTIEKIRLDGNALRLKIIIKGADVSHIFLPNFLLAAPSLFFEPTTKLST